MNDNFSVLEKEISIFLELFDQYPDIDELPRWKSMFEKAGKESMAVLRSDCSWELKSGKLIDLSYFFAPRMGSFREDCPEELMDKSRGLISSTHDCLRLCWQKSGKETFNIPQEDLFSVGDKVNLVNGELLFLSFGGYKEVAAFEEIHTYEVIEYAGVDISNMPTYNIQYGQTIRPARHNALTKIG